jgi:hypothetical protein
MSVEVPTVEDRLLRIDRMVRILGAAAGSFRKGDGGAELAGSIDLEACLLTRDIDAVMKALPVASSFLPAPDVQETQEAEP